MKITPTMIEAAQFADSLTEFCRRADKYIVINNGELLIEDSGLPTRIKLVFDRDSLRYEVEV